MSSTIWKYPIPTEDEFAIDMPRMRRFLHIDTQHGKPCMWFACDPGHGSETVQFSLRGTGHGLRGVDPDTHLGTFLIENDSLVFHLFLKGSGK